MGEVLLTATGALVVLGLGIAAVVYLLTLTLRQTRKDD